MIIPSNITNYIAIAISVLQLSIFSKPCSPNFKTFEHPKKTKVSMQVFSRVLSAANTLCFFVHMAEFQSAVHNKSTTRHRPRLCLKPTEPCLAHLNTHTNMTTLFVFSGAGDGLCHQWTQMRNLQFFSIRPNAWIINQIQLQHTIYDENVILILNFYF